VTIPEHPTSPNPILGPGARRVCGELRHQIEIDHQVYLALLHRGPAGDLNARLRRLLRLDPGSAPSAGASGAPSRAAADQTVQIHASAQREHPPRSSDPTSAHALRTAIRALADLLGIEPCDITVRGDQRVPPGQQPVVLLTVTDGARHHEFAIPGGRSDRILAVLPCPLCAQPVATCLIADLAAYGTLLATLPLAAIAFDEQHWLLEQVAEEFFTDPGHAPTCRYSPHTEQGACRDAPAS
jgi:hypothetical protein